MTTNKYVCMVEFVGLELLLFLMRNGVMVEMISVKREDSRVIQG